MEIILLESFDRLGKIGDVVNVKDGFARNYLLPKKKALRASEENKKYYESIKKDIQDKNKKLADEAKQTLNKLSEKEIIFIRQASDTGQLYGSVSPKDISNKLKDSGHNIPPSKINLSSAIKNLGIFDVIIKLHADVSFKISLNVATSNEDAQQQKLKDSKKEDSVSKKINDIQENRGENLNESSKDKKQLGEKAQTVEQSTEDPKELLTKNVKVKKSGDEKKK